MNNEKKKSNGKFVISIILVYNKLYYNKSVY